MDKQFDIAAIGTLAYDMILRTVDESVFTRDTTVLEEVGISVGGGAMLSAIAAQRLGWKATVVGKLCTDAFSDYCVDVLKKAGVDTSYVTRSETDTMSLTFALVRPNGDRHFLGRLGSNNRTLSPRDFDLSVVTKAKIVSYGSFLVLPELDQEMPRIFHAAREAGALTVADCANDSYHQGAETVLRCLPETDYFIPSQVEADGSGRNGTAADGTGLPQPYHQAGRGGLLCDRWRHGPDRACFQSTPRQRHHRCRRQLCGRLYGRIAGGS